jgi:CHAD domain-containing protein
VPGLDPDGSFLENAARIVRVRLDELYAFDPAIRDPERVTELHDMRIAAKRLRYVLEIVGFSFGKVGARLEGEAKWLQEVLGEIHDADVLVPEIDAHVAALREQDRAFLVGIGPSAAALASLPNRDRYVGLEALVVFTTARRTSLYGTFIERWDTLVGTGFRERVLAALRKATP